ncbi:alpha/beta hydrolase, partial [Cupriavidus sp. CER94]|uniref:alpha/beta hydrolase n=1 Tax=Cupriavidus sp. CER94 TaxID=3377036 RepID=UPI0038258DD9
MHRVFQSTALALAAGFLLYGCGGGDDNGSATTASTPAPTAPTVQPEEVRPQDSRTFTVDTNALAAKLVPLAGAPASDRWSGQLGNAGYVVEVPAAWNGKLVMYALGYAGMGSALSVTIPGIRRHLLEAGYAWAASTYSTNYYDVRAGLEDTNALALAFTDIAKKNGRTLAAPTRTYIVGHSMGGHVAAAAVDAENVQTAVHKVSYNGAVPMCAVLGDTELFNYFGGYQTAAQQLAGMPATSWPVTNWAQIVAPLMSALFTTYPSATTAAGDKLKAVVKNLTGGERPLFELGFGQSPASKAYQDAVWSTFGSDGTVNGILTQNVVDTTALLYQFDNDPAQSAEEQAFNAAIFRVRPVADANRLRRDGLRWIPQNAAKISVPVLTLHTLGDMYVPFSMEQIYKRRADANGTASWLVQRAIRGIAHCDFTVAEQTRAFDDMVTWEQTHT